MSPINQPLAPTGAFLQALAQICPQRALSLTDENGNIDGYLIVQGKRIGPWAMRKLENAEPLLQAALSLSFPGSVSVVVPGENMDVIDLMQSHGFEIVRVNRHMARGPVARIGDRSQIFALTSLSLG